jgi:hypothetical protein
VAKWAWEKVSEVGKQAANARWKPGKTVDRLEADTTGYLLIVIYSYIEFIVDVEQISADKHVVTCVSP